MVRGLTFNKGVIISTQTVPLSSLQPPSANSRPNYGHKVLAGLAASTKTDGLLQRLVVAPTRGKKAGFRIVAGERRDRILKLLEKQGEITADCAVPVELRDGLSPRDILRLATVENLQREGLVPLDHNEGVGWP